MLPSGACLIPSNLDGRCGANEDVTCSMHAAAVLGRGQSQAVLPHVSVCRNVDLLPIRAEMIHPQNRFWPALALLAVICGTAPRPDSKTGQMLI